MYDVLLGIGGSYTNLHWIHTAWFGTSTYQRSLLWDKKKRTIYIIWAAGDKLKWYVGTTLGFYDVSSTKRNKIRYFTIGPFGSWKQMMDTLVICFPWWLWPITNHHVPERQRKKSTGLEKLTTLFSKKAIENYVKSAALLEMQIVGWPVHTERSGASDMAHFMQDIWIMLTI